MSSSTLQRKTEGTSFLKPRRLHESIKNLINRRPCSKETMVVDVIIAKEQRVCQEEREDLSDTNANRRKL